MVERSATGPLVENYLVHAILITIFCCLPLGIPAIAYAASANSKAKQGDTEGAKLAAGKAKDFCMISFVLGIVMIIFKVWEAVGKVLTWDHY